MITIYVNGEACAVSPSSSIAELLVALGLENKRVAVELNREIVPRSRHPQTLLQGGDCVEIVHAIGGG